MAVPEHLIPVIKRIDALAVSAPPSPWRLTVQSGIGDLTDVGFGPDTDLLLVVSSQGRGLFDCTTGDRVARDGDVDTDFHDAARLRADGIGTLSGCSVPMAGLSGGGLSRGTSDGWTVDDFTLEWPRAFVIPPDDERKSVRPGQTVKIDFTFAPESEPKEGNESERIWVAVKERVDDHWIGVLDNDPRFHDTIKSGHEFHFHPDHIVVIWRDS